MMATEENIENTNAAKKPKRWLGVRHVQTLMIFLGMTLSLCGRVTMSFAIVAMTDSNNENFFDWTIQTQSVILSAFPWGYVFIQAGTGELASKFGGMSLLIVSLGVSSIVALFLPLAAVYGGWIMVCACRFIQGLMQGLLYPTVHYLIGKWIPLDERGRMSSFIFGGSQFGTASQLIVSGYIANYWGWAAIFYMNGAAGLIWIVIYLLVGSDNPQVSKLISAEERLYIQSSLGQIGGHKRLKTPWKAILTSVPYLATVVANIGYCWGYWVLLTEIPTYMNKVLKVDIKSNGVMSALPYIAMFIMNFPVGFSSDYILKKKCVTLSTSRKIFNTVGFFGPAIILLCLTYVPPGNVALAVFLLCLTLGVSAGFYNGYLVAFLDLAQNFSSTLMGISNCVANVVALFAPLSVGFILNDETDPVEWQTIFNISAAVYIVTNIVFVLFATSEEQEWNKGTEVTKKTINESI